MVIKIDSSSRGSIPNVLLVCKCHQRVRPPLESVESVRVSATAFLHGLLATKVQHLLAIIDQLGDMYGVRRAISCRISLSFTACQHFE
jgi:hypothetical protein